MLGDEARFVSEPPPVERSFACHVCAPTDEGAVAPEPPPLVSPYVIVAVAPPASVSPETVTVRPATATLPALARVYPLADEVVLGADQPAGTSTVTSPFEIPPVAAV